MHQSIKPNSNSPNRHLKPPRSRLHPPPIRGAKEWRKRGEKTVRPKHQNLIRLLRHQLHANPASPRQARKLQSKAPTKHLQTPRQPNMRHHISRCRKLYPRRRSKTVQFGPTHQQSRTPNVVEPLSPSWRLHHPIRKGIPCIPNFL
jgi:hypothetical protein